MDKRQKDIILKDVLARMPYNVTVYGICAKEPVRLVSVRYDKTYGNHLYLDENGINHHMVKPYLRPMSSMTEKELTELAYKVLQQPDIDIVRRWVFENKLYPSIDGNPAMVIDWLNSHFFDYNGLIEMGLAMEAPEDMYKVVDVDPNMEEYKQLKAIHPDNIILFRCGDFYETYNEDARTCASVLGITLNKSTKSGQEMTGFPHHALDAYLPKLIRNGHRVCIADSQRRY